MRYTMIFPVINKPESDTKTTHIKCEVYYSKGGINYFTYKNEARGYYMSVTPVERKNGFESFIAFTGCKTCILPVARQSKKQADIAKGKFLTMYKGFLATVLPEYTIGDNYEVKENN